MIKKALFMLLCTGLVVGCKKDDPPKPPEAAILVFPDANSECTTGTEVSSGSTEITFRWQASKYTDSYTLRVTNVSDGSKSYSETVTTTTANLTLEKGQAYSWYVTSFNDKVDESQRSERWYFYNEGNAEEDRAPLPASLVFPPSGSSVSRNVENQVVLRWSAGDLDNDLVNFGVYLDTQNPPQHLEVSLGKNEREYKAIVQPATTYYWRVVAKDRADNTADSGVFSFKVH